MKLIASVVSLILISIFISSCLFFPSKSKDIWVLETVSYYDYYDSLEAVWTYVTNGMNVEVYDDNGMLRYINTYDEHGNEIEVQTYFEGYLFSRQVTTFQEYRPDVWVKEGYYHGQGNTLFQVYDYQIAGDTLKKSATPYGICVLWQILDKHGNALHEYGPDNMGQLNVHIEYRYEHLANDVYVCTGTYYHGIGTDEIYLQYEYILEDLTLYRENETTGELEPYLRYDERGLLVERWNSGRIEYTYQTLNNDQ